VQIKGGGRKHAIFGPTNFGESPKAFHPIDEGCASSTFLLAMLHLAMLHPQLLIAHNLRLNRFPERLSRRKIKNGKIIMQELIGHEAFSSESPGSNEVIPSC